MRPLLWAAAVAGFLASPAVYGDETDACLSSYDGAQKARIEGRLADAQAELRNCAKPTCPPIVQNDCVVWLREVEAALPTVIFSARETSGEDVIDVVVEVDGKRVLTAITGKGIAVDPGVHVVRFVRGADVVEQKLVVVEGEKARVVRVTFAPHATERPALPAAEPTRRVPVASYILGTVGVIALGVGGSLLYSGTRELNHYRDTCAPNCEPDPVDATRRKLRYGDLAVGIGLLSIGAAVVLHYVQPRELPRTASASVDLVRGGAVLGFFTAF